MANIRTWHLAFIAVETRESGDLLEFEALTRAAPARQPAYLGHLLTIAGRKSGCHNLPTADVQAPMVSFGG